MRTLLLGCVAAAALAMPIAGLSHHSTANFDQTKSSTVTGTVKYFSFTNPHSFIDLDVPGKAGAATPFKIFTVARVVMLRSGWANGDVKAGDKVTVTGNPDRQDAHYMYLTKIVFQSGKLWSNDNVQR